MTATLAGEHLQLRETAREFARHELEPRAERWDRERAFPADAVARLGELGFLGLLVPEESGGSGFDSVGFCLAVEEVSRAVPALGVLLAEHNGPATRLVGAAPEGVRDAWLPRLASGEVLVTPALAEPEAGSDPAAVQTRAEAAPDGVRLTGEKAWVSGAGVTGASVVFARTDVAGSEADGGGAALLASDVVALAPFLVDLAGTGVEVGQPEETMGLRALPLGSVRLRAAPAQGGAPLAAGDRRTLEDAVALGRLGAAAVAVGVAGRCIELALAYAAERRQFGRPIGEFQGVRGPLAELAARTAAARALLYATAAARDGAATPGGPAADGAVGEEGVRLQAAMVKLVAAELAMDAALQAMQTYGGYGYVKDYPVERFFRDAKACQLIEGTHEIQRLVIARRLLGG